MVDYSTYVSYVETLCSDNDLSSFKSDPNYSNILEHVSSEDGKKYLECINNYTNLSFEDVRDFCLKNDSIGTPNKTKYGFLTTSPTSLRYVYHAHIILTHLQTLNLPSIDILEIGGGYGGLCLAMYNFSEKYNIKINSYTIVDLPSILKLQKKYISLLSSTVFPDFVDANTFGSTLNKSKLFLISNYCFSEISYDFQRKYINHLFPKVSHGFMAWNYIPLYDFGFSYRVEDETPNLGAYFNRFVYF